MIRLEICTHSGSIDVVEVETYTAEDVANKINDESVHALAFGDNVYSRIDLKNIRVLEK